MLHIVDDPSDRRCPNIDGAAKVCGASQFTTREAEFNTGCLS